MLTDNVVCHIQGLLRLVTFRADESWLLQVVHVIPWPDPPAKGEHRHRLATTTH